MFFSAASNKLINGLFGAYDFVFHSHRDLREQVRVIADGEEADYPATPRVILLNINSYAGGVKMWEKSKRGRLRNCSARGSAADTATRRRSGGI